MKAINPKGPNKGAFRVIRGGSWVSRAGNLVVSDRLSTTPGNRDDDLGFRIVCNVRKG